MEMNRGDQGSPSKRARMETPATSTHNGVDGPSITERLESLQTKFETLLEQRVSKLLLKHNDLARIVEKNDHSAASIQKLEERNDEMSKMERKRIEKEDSIEKLMEGWRTEMTEFRVWQDEAVTKINEAARQQEKDERELKLAQEKAFREFRLEVFNDLVRKKAELTQMFEKKFESLNGSGSRGNSTPNPYSLSTAPPLSNPNMVQEPSIEPIRNSEIDKLNAQMLKNSEDIKKHSLEAKKNATRMWNQHKLLEKQVLDLRSEFDESETAAENSVAQSLGVKSTTTSVDSSIKVRVEKLESACLERSNLIDQKITASQEISSRLEGKLKAIEYQLEANKIMCGENAAKAQLGQDNTDALVKASDTTNEQRARRFDQRVIKAEDKIIKLDNILDANNARAQTESKAQEIKQKVDQLKDSLLTVLDEKVKDLVSTDLLHSSMDGIRNQILQQVNGNLTGIDGRLEGFITKEGSKKEIGSFTTKIHYSLTSLSTQQNLVQDALRTDLSQCSARQDVLRNEINSLVTRFSSQSSNQVASKLILDRVLTLEKNQSRWVATESYQGVLRGRIENMDKSLLERVKLESELKSTITGLGIHIDQSNARIESRIKNVELLTGQTLDAKFTGTHQYIQRVYHTLQDEMRKLKDELLNEVKKKISEIRGNGRLSNEDEKPIVLRLAVDIKSLHGELQTLQQSFQTLQQTMQTLRGLPEAITEHNKRIEIVHNRAVAISNHFIKQEQEIKQLAGYYQQLLLTVSNLVDKDLPSIRISITGINTAITKTILDVTNLQSGMKKYNPELLRLDQAITTLTSTIAKPNPCLEIPRVMREIARLDLALLAAAKIKALVVPTPIVVKDLANLTKSSELIWQQQIKGFVVTLINPILIKIDGKLEAMNSTSSNHSNTLDQQAALLDIVNKATVELTKTLKKFS